MAVAAAILLAIGLKRALSRRIVHRGKVVSVAFSGIALLVAAFAVLTFFAARKLPSADAAPQVGQKVPDFALPDTSGKTVSLDQLLAAFPAPAASAVAYSQTSPETSPLSRLRPPKAALLIFYRGYW